jgi:hypothetical protein
VLSGVGRGGDARAIKLGTQRGDVGTHRFELAARSTQRRVALLARRALGGGVGRRARLRDACRLEQAVGGAQLARHALQCSALCGGVGRRDVELAARRRQRRLEPRLLGVPCVAFARQTRNDAGLRRARGVGGGARTLELEFERGGAGGGLSGVVLGDCKRRFEPRHVAVRCAQRRLESAAVGARVCIELRHRLEQRRAFGRPVERGAIVRGDRRQRLGLRRLQLRRRAFEIGEQRAAVARCALELASRRLEHRFESHDVGRLAVALARHARHRRRRRTSRRRRLCRNDLLRIVIGAQFTCCAYRFASAFEFRFERCDRAQLRSAFFLCAGEHRFESRRVRRQRVALCFELRNRATAVCRCRTRLFVATPTTNVRQIRCSGTRYDAAWLLASESVRVRREVRCIARWQSAVRDVAHRARWSADHSSPAARRASIRRSPAADALRPAPAQAPSSPLIVRNE